VWIIFDDVGVYHCTVPGTVAAIPREGRAGAGGNRTAVVKDGECMHSMHRFLNHSCTKIRYITEVITDILLLFSKIFVYSKDAK
jgi:hypothetical protein